MAQWTQDNETLFKNSGPAGAFTKRGKTIGSPHKKKNSQIHTRHAVAIQIDGNWHSFCPHVLLFRIEVYPSNSSTVSIPDSIIQKLLTSFLFSPGIGLLNSTNKGSRCLRCFAHNTSVSYVEAGYTWDPSLDVDFRPSFFLFAFVPVLNFASPVLVPYNTIT